MSGGDAAAAPSVGPTEDVQQDVAEGPEVVEGWDDINDADVLPFSEVIGPSDTEDLLDSEGDGATQAAIPVPRRRNLRSSRLTSTV